MIYFVADAWSTSRAG